MKNISFKMSFEKFMVDYGTLIILGIIFVMNLIIGLVMKKWYNKTIFQFFASTALEIFFLCQEGIVSNHKQNGGELRYVMPICDNIDIDIKTKNLQILFYVYFNLFVMCISYFGIQTVFLQEKLSPLCIEGWICEAENPFYTNLTCDNDTIPQNITDQTNFLCSNYTYESVDSLFTNIGTAYSIYLLVLKINCYFFKYSLKLLTNKCMLKLIKEYMLGRLRIFWYFTVWLQIVQIVAVWVLTPWTVYGYVSGKTFNIATRSTSSKIASIAITSYICFLIGVVAGTSPVVNRYIEYNKFNKDILLYKIDDAGQKVTISCSVPKDIDKSVLNVSRKDLEIIIKARYEDEYFKQCQMPENTDFDQLKCYYEGDILKIEAPIKSKEIHKIEIENRNFNELNIQ